MKSIALMAGLASLAATLATPLAQAQNAPNTQDAQMLNIRSLAATCANCHGTNGKAHEGAAVATLAGRSKDDIVAQMKAFQSGARSATIMHQLAKGYSEQQIEQIAAYFAAQKN